MNGTDGLVCWWELDCGELNWRLMGRRSLVDLSDEMGWERLDFADVLVGIYIYKWCAYACVLTTALLAPTSF